MNDGRRQAAVEALALLQAATFSIKITRARAEAP